MDNSGETKNLKRQVQESDYLFMQIANLAGIAKYRFYQFLDGAIKLNLAEKKRLSGILVHLP